jgi:hypothetical protein
MEFDPNIKYLNYINKPIVLCSFDGRKVKRVKSMVFDVNR